MSPDDSKSADEISIRARCLTIWTSACLLFVAIVQPSVAASPADSNTASVPATSTTSEVQAAPNFDYDFESLVSDATLVGQDSWAAWSPWQSPYVSSGPGINPSKTTAGIGVTGLAQGAQRYLAQPFRYDPSDTAVVWDVWGLTSGAVCDNALGGLVYEYPQLGAVYFGSNSNCGDFHLTTFLGATSGYFFGDALSFGDWYEFRLVIDFSVQGGSATLSYRDVTLGQTAFTTDGGIRDKNLGLTQDCLGGYTFTRVLGGCPAFR